MARLKDWLKTNRDEVKFVATAVPFVGEARSGSDKWCGDDFRHQRDELIEFLAAERVGKPVFLTGDMHCSYHATMTLPHPTGDLVIHELMSSPINQVPNGIHALRTSVVATTSGGVDYSVNLDEGEFYGEHSNVMHVKATACGQISWIVHRPKAAEASTPAVPSRMFPPRSPAPPARGKLSITAIASAAIAPVGTRIRRNQTLREKLAARVPAVSR